VSAIRGRIIEQVHAAMHYGCGRATTVYLGAIEWEEFERTELRPLLGIRDSRAMIGWSPVEWMGLKVYEVKANSHLGLDVQSLP
jgi:hypothetical protein